MVICEDNEFLDPKEIIAYIIQYESHQSAISARKFLQERDIYDGCCRLDIQFSSFDELQVKFNNERAHDIIIHIAIVESKTENPHNAHVQYPNHPDYVKNLSTNTAHMKDAIVDVSDAQVEFQDMVEDTELVELVELEDCDASILLEDIASLEGEKGVAVNLNSVETANRIKKVVEKCKGGVSCACILTVRDFTSILGAPNWSEELAKIDARTASLVYFLSYTLRTRWFLKRGRMIWVRAGQRGRGPKSGRWAETCDIACYLIIWACAFFII
ncbi:hypothetical protein CASFOL_027224 [Castilleja foliolosa]|uniref:peroxidase n=1 Tax=Castilleja foliolosa TaxID=1961234 RepID=A0ABD3CE77_9LAMI